ncbi:hypothetical protein SAMN04487894_108172 [Niabella drilacis]|uniref:Outer membrane protein beta-barrel domain-containing protein n=2 Tax=Niabella drilacis (strain DSM 25811 / CCM 8410 / CCUG 62505 / LMG 26954 / E90) TaxID=1285928 RepID=A0A1G6U767_NIADE|nr:hypothetical protein SAMN04487894_108172 [Niabella drilacis]
MATTLYAQGTERSPFRRGYLRLGISNIPGKLNQAMSPKENILASQYGSGTGYVLEIGKAYYFNRPQAGDRLGYGLDWTVFSASYNPLNRWKAYETTAGDPGATTTPAIMGLSSKLGPVLSVNAVEKLVIDARVQLVASASYYNFEYAGGSRYFHLINAQKNEDDNGVTSALMLGLKPSFGLTVRRGIIGLALDYAPGKIKMNYEEGTGTSGEYTYGQKELEANSLQLKLNISF